MVEWTISDLLPLVQGAELAIEKYYESPSIRNGSYMMEMKKLAQKNIEQTSRLLWIAWKENFKGYVSAEEYCEIMEETLKKLRPEGEGHFWASRVAPELENGKEVK